MSKEATLLKYGIAADLVKKLLQLELSVTTIRNTSIINLKNKYQLTETEANLVKLCVTRTPIDEGVINQLLINNNFTCCCCTGLKSYTIIIHHIEEYEISQDNSYNNLAVLCPVCHDLAHSSRGLTKSFPKESVIQAKLTWEKICKEKRGIVNFLPLMQSWQAAYEEHEGDSTFRYLFDLTLIKESGRVQGYFSIIYSDRGNVFIAGEFQHLDGVVDTDTEFVYWEMQWGLRVSGKLKFNVVLNYGIEDTIVCITPIQPNVIPRILELHLVTSNVS